jgi:hypothetical protein
MQMHNALAIPPCGIAGFVWFPRLRQIGMLASHRFDRYNEKKADRQELKMEKVLATYRQGQVLLDQPVDWPEGTRIEVCPTAQPRSAQDEIEALSRAFNDPDRYGLDDSLWPTTREGIEFLLAQMDATEPLDLTPEEQRLIDEAFESNKREQKELMKKSWSELEKLF